MPFLVTPALSFSPAEYQGFSYSQKCRRIMITPQTAETLQQTMLEQLDHPLQSHMQQHLKAQHLAALRSTCAAGCQLIDDAKVMTLRPALHMLPAVVLDCAHDSLELQRLLRAHAKTCQRLRAGTMVPQLSMLPASQKDQGHARRICGQRQDLSSVCHPA